MVCKRLNRGFGDSRLGWTWTQMAKCHVWPPDQFSSENMRFSHLAMGHLAI
jgi:hypothetical protein